MFDPSPKRVLVKELPQIDFVVKDLQKTIESYWNLLGIGPWEIYELRPPELNNTSYYGKATEFSIRVGITTVGNVALEMIEPLSGENVYSDFIEEYGEGFFSKTRDARGAGRQGFIQRCRFFSADRGNRKAP